MRTKQVIFSAFFWAIPFVAHAATSGNELDPSWVSNQLDELRLTAMASNIQSESFAQAALNPTVLKLFSDNPSYTYELPTGDITNQEQTGDCSIYATLNVLRSRLLVRKVIDPKFQFSQNYVHFYFLLEKANRYFNRAIALGDRHFTLPELQRELGPGKNIGDGSWWENTAFIAEKYGLVPIEAMPDTKSSLGDSTLLQELDFVTAGTVKALHAAGGASSSDLYALKTRGMSEVLRVLQAHLGKPPRGFSYSGTKYTPSSYFKNFVQFDFSQYAHMSAYPTLPVDQHYEWKEDQSGTASASNPLRDIEFVNTTKARLLELATNSVLSDYAPWISLDVVVDMDRTSGILHPDIYDRGAAYGFSPAEVSSDFGMALGLVNPDHAVAIVGVDQPNPGSAPVKFKLENSWGAQSGTNGFYHMYREWFDRYVFDVVVPKVLLTSTEQEELSKKPLRINENLGGFNN